MMANFKFLSGIPGGVRVFEIIARCKSLILKGCLGFIEIPRFLKSKRWSFFQDGFGFLYNFIKLIRKGRQPGQGPGKALWNGGFSLSGFLRFSRVWLDRLDSAWYSITECMQSYSFQKGICTLTPPQPYFTPFARFSSEFTTFLAATPLILVKFSYTMRLSDPIYGAFMGIFAQIAAYQTWKGQNR